MPINRPSLKLNFPLVNERPINEGPLVPSTYDDLKNNFYIPHNQMQQMPIPQFSAALDAPDYSGLRKCGFFTLSEGFQLNNHADDVFIHARRETPHCKGEFSGDKFHISVLGEQVPQAYQALSELLFSKDSPIDKWKVTDMERADQQCRVSVGAEFTLYVKPDQKNSHYSASLLHITRQFTERVESILSENGVIPGQHPESDVQPEKWKYLSYRNELRSGREGSEMQSQALREEPFYRLMTE
ncbi:type III secretion system effector phosphothreonine lyase [Erwinia mallotivora]|uniref:type III secretion system effector phosphothreonine lyase n=1 Tax=Erwinia mallotivora TaxID=69222 RepID=UPI0021BE1DEB|nr:type III secretion system effector phosphothreonine lyase [Erwinia mallotivora]